MNTDIRFERLLREALSEEETPPQTDARIVEEIRKAAAKTPGHSGSGTLPPGRFAWRIAASFAAVLAAGALVWLHGTMSQQHAAVHVDEGEVVLEIIGMASLDEFYAVSSL